MWYTAARAIFNVMKWLWLFVIASFLFTYAANIAPLPASQFFKTFYQSTFGWFFLPGLRLALTLIVLGALLLLTLVAWLIARRTPQDDEERKGAPIQVQQSHHNRGDSAQAQDGGQAVIIKHNQGSTFVFSPQPDVSSTQPDAQPQRDAILNTYLDGVISQCQRINPTGIAKPASQPLLSVSVPLEKIFIHIRAVSDRPRFGLVIEQRQIEAEIASLRERSDLPPDELEAQIAGLKARLWQSELGENLLEPPPKKEGTLTIEDVFGKMTAEQPVSLLLGGPGAGKSTTMCWLALQMARAARSQSSFPEKLAPAQIPILVRISDYANYLEDPENRIPRPPNANGQAHLVKAFLEQELAKTDDLLPGIIKAELERGHCLLLFDGLDEVAGDSLRRQVAADIDAFISGHCTQRTQSDRFNRVIITSRIVGYEPGPLSQYREYTLLDLTDEQIEAFLTHWCPAIELFQATRQRDERDLTTQDHRRLQTAGEAQREELLRALRDNHGIKRLAVNPLMLTILALIQKSGGKLPHRRIDLFHSVTQTLLDNWNQTRGGRRFGPDEIGLAEDALSLIAFEMHRRDLSLTRQRVLGLARLSIAAFYQQSPQDIPQDAVETFITTLSESSGLFVERGQGLFGFMHRTFQEYYVARYLLKQRNWTPDALISTGAANLTAFALAHYWLPLWRESLLLAVASLSEQENQRAEATTIIYAILNAPAACDAVLQRHLLFAASCVVDCHPWYIDGNLQQEIAMRLLDIYGDNLGSGRYTKLQQDVEQLALLWLRGQPAESAVKTPHLLATWRAALCDPDTPQRQEGAVHLLAAIAPDLATCPKLVLQEFVPPLLQLADVFDIPGIPDEIRTRLPDPPACTTNPNIEDYAFIALRLLDKDGPPGWLHAQWLIWAESQPELLDRLTQHALEIDYLLTPAAFPERPDDPDWERLGKIAKNWQERASHDPRELQTELLQASKAAYYPHAFLFYQLLVSEATERRVGEDWKSAWDRELEQEMQRGRGATYQACFYLRLTLAKVDEQQHLAITDVLVRCSSIAGSQQMGAINIITINNYLRYLFDLRDLRYLRHLRYLRYLIDLRYLKHTLNLIKMKRIKYLIDLRDIRDLINMRDRGELISMINMRDLINMKELTNLIQSLFDILDQAAMRVPILLALYSVIGYRGVTDEMREHIEQNLQLLEKHQHLPLEVQLLATAIRSSVGGTASAPVKTAVPPLWGTADERARVLDRLKQHMPLAKAGAHDLFLACFDNDVVSAQTWKSLRLKGYYHQKSVGQLAWSLLGEAWIMTPEAWQMVIAHLDDEDVLMCGAAARLLQKGKGMLPAEREKAKQRIQAILADEILSRRPLDPPGGGWLRLDDVLFDALRALAEQA